MAEHYLFPEPAGNPLSPPGKGRVQSWLWAEESVQTFAIKAGQQQGLRHNSVTEVPDVE